jgi:hypothetical protein
MAFFAIEFDTYLKRQFTPSTSEGIDNEAS